MLKKLLIAFVVLLVLAVAVGFLLPSAVDVERSVVIAAPPAAVHAHIADLRKWKDWSPFEKYDDTIVYTYSGAESGVGASYSWTSEDSGEGILEIKKSDPETGVVYDISFDQGKTWSEGAIGLEQTAEGTRASWRWGTDLGANILYRYLMVFLKGQMDDLMDEGLDALAEIVESEAKASGQPAPTPSGE